MTKLAPSVKQTGTIPVNIFRKRDRATWGLGGAIYFGSPIEDIRKKIAAGADVNGDYSNSVFRKSFLGWAAAHGRQDVVRVLLENGAKTEPEGLSVPLIDAISNRHAECAEALINAGADADARRETGNPPLLVAVGNGMGDTVRQLLEKGADVNVQSSSGNTALHIAAEKGYANIVALLIEKGADPKMTNGNLNTPADVAEREYPGLAAMIRGKSGEPRKPTLESALEWQLLTPNEIARVSVRDKIGYRITEIFNFSARTYAHIASNLESKAESQALKSFAEIDGELIETAHAELLRQGGKAGASSLKKKLPAPGV